MKTRRTLPYLISIAALGLLAPPRSQGHEPAGNVTDARVAAETSGENWLHEGWKPVAAAIQPAAANHLRERRQARARLGDGLDEPMGLAAEPLEVDGVIYLSAPRSVVYAIDCSHRENHLDLRPACSTRSEHR